MMSTMLIEWALAEQSAYTVGCIWFGLCDDIVEALVQTSTEIGIELSDRASLTQMVRSQMRSEILGELVESADADDLLVEGLMTAASKLGSIVGNVLAGAAKMAVAFGGGILKGMAGEDEAIMAATRLATGAGKLLGRSVKLTGAGLARAGSAAVKAGRNAAPHVGRAAKAAGSAAQKGLDRAKQRYRDRIDAGCPDGERMVFGVCRRIRQTA